MTRRRLIRRAGALLALALVAGVGAAGVFIASPLPEGLTAYRPVASVRILDREGGLLREVLSRADGRSTPVDAATLPAGVRAAFLAAEDHHFERHPGVWPPAVARAAWQNLRAGRVVSGGSTITQQLARLLVPRERNLPGKVMEALWALRLEVHLGKAEILSQYLNRVPFGNGTFGIEAAARLYFAKPARSLSLGQAALLAAIPRGPGVYNPYRHPERVMARRAWVLSRLAATGLAEDDAVAAAREEPADLTAFSAAFRAPHLVELVLSRLDELGLSQAVEITTSVDPALQAEVEDQIRQELAQMSARRVSSAAVVVVDNDSRQVLAYAGSPDFFDEAIGGQNDGVQMRRQPGSALKPFVYAEAFRRGFTPATVVPDLDTAFAAAKGAYAPKNYDRRVHGPVRVREALGSSFNVPAVRVTDALGVHEVLEVLRRAGFASLEAGAEHYGLGLALGNGEVSLWELARAYAGLARGGRVAGLVPVIAARDAAGRPLRVRPELDARRFADRRAVALVTHVLADPAARARAFGLDNALRLRFPAAAKTGTSKGYSDNWTAGYTAERTVAVWAGNFDGTPMVQVSGISGAGPIFKRVMTRAMGERTPRPLVDTSSLDHAVICPLSGQRAGPACPVAMGEYFVPGTAPGTSCAMHGHLAADLEPDLARRCAALARRAGGLVDLGVDFYDWARNEGLHDEPWLAALCFGERSSTAARLLHPAKGDEFLLLSDLPLADQAVPVRVRAPASAGRLTLVMDGVAVSRLDPPYTGRVPAIAGEHRLELRDERHELLDAVNFRVRR